MLNRIAARIIRRRLLRQLVASRSAMAVAGVAGAVAATGATIAALRRFRNRPARRVELLSTNGPSTAALEELTRDELYDMARQRDIRGRSSMSKSELKEALASN
jgi:hypothetical protein